MGIEPTIVGSIPTEVKRNFSFPRVNVPLCYLAYFVSQSRGNYNTYLLVTLQAQVSECALLKTFNCSLSRPMDGNYLCFVKQQTNK